MCFKNSTILLIFFFFFAFQVEAGDSEIEDLKEQLAVLSKEIAKLRPLIAEAEHLKSRIQALGKAQHANVSDTAIVSPNNKVTDNKTLQIYATVRPTIGYIEENGTSLSDVRDALSHAGFKSTYTFKDGWTAVLHGEWGIDLSNNGDFGRARQVYVALDTPYGKLGLGKQRPVQYLFIAEYIDIFNHASSPFSYDPESLFFVDNLLTYQKKMGNFTWMAVSQFDGKSGDNHSDLFNTGLSYSNEGLHAAITYTQQDSLFEGAKNGEDIIYGASLAYSFDNDLYVALGLQDKQYKRQSLLERSGHTFDLALAYPFADHYKVKLGYFDFNDGLPTAATRNFNGGNITLEWLPADGLRFHIEYLYRDFEQQEDFNSVSFGFRYDYSYLLSL